MGAEPLAKPDTQDPPKRLVERAVRVSVSGENTLRLPFDVVKPESTKDRYFPVSNPADPPNRRMKPIRADNEVKYLIGGPLTFLEMARVIAGANAPGHFIYLINFFIDPNVQLGNGKSLGQMLTAAVKSGAKVRGMFFDKPAGNQNEAAVELLKKLGKDVTSKHDSAAIWDTAGPATAVCSHHQKILCVFGNFVPSEGGPARDQLVAFVGGVDFNPDRIHKDGDFDDETGTAKNIVVSDSSGHGAPLHDVHCRVVGPAADDLLENFFDRWNDHDDHKKIDLAKGPLLRPPVSQPAGKAFVQIARTIAHSIGYSFAPEGEQTAQRLLLKAIRAARKFIYTECQYFPGTDLMLKALTEALQNNQIQHLTVVITAMENTDVPADLLAPQRRKFIQALKEAAGDPTGTKTLLPSRRIRVFQIKPETKDSPRGAFRSYVHSKIWLIDDEFATIGSVNANNRSWTHDNESLAATFETLADKPASLRFAHWLRMKIWAQHLNMETDDGFAELVDGVASGAQWVDLPPGSRVAPYDEFKFHADVPPDFDAWKFLYDPT